MAPQQEAKPKRDSLTFISFLQCSRQSKSSSNDSGIGGTYDNNIQSDDVFLISSDEDDDEGEFEMLCEVEFDEMEALPIPIEQKPVSKTEPVNNLYINPSENASSLEPKTEQNGGADQMILDECDEDLLSLFKEESFGDSILKLNSYILFICPQCGNSFHNSASWKKHMDYVHNLSVQRTFNFTQYPSNKFQCNKCQTVITRCTLKTLQQHYFSHLPFKLYKCKLCPHEERSLYLMISHIMLHKDNEELDSIKTVKEPKSLKTSLLIHESSSFIAYICPVCRMCFDAEDTWQAHINFKHNFLEKTAENRFGDHFKCFECNVEIFSQHVADLQQHLFTHLPFKSYLKCKLCNWTVSRRNFLISHILYLHERHLSQRVLTALIQIENRDNDIGVVVPTIDTEKSPTPRQVETTPVPKYSRHGFRCSRCTECFSTAAERNAHNVSQHGKYVCSMCNENFALKMDWRRHNCIFQEQFQCPRCSKKYHYEKCYKNHMRRCRII